VRLSLTADTVLTQDRNVTQQQNPAPQAAMAVCRDVKARFARVVSNLEPIAMSSDPVFADPREVMLETVLAIHELEACIPILRKVYWPVP
jgi:hypothetical protein